MSINKKPKIRFKGFTDDWEKSKLGEVTEISKGVQRGKQEISEVQTVENPYPVYNGGQDVSGYTNEFNRENKVMVSEGGASAGFVNYYKSKYWSGGHNFTIDNLENDINFIRAILDANQEKLYGLKVGSGLPNVQLGSIKEFEIIIPKFKEQTQIGTFFVNLDCIIALHQCKYEKLQNIKKSMLGKMFPKPGSNIPEIRFKKFTDDWEQRKLYDEVKFYKGLTYTPADIVENEGTLILRSSNVQNSEIITDDKVYVNSEVANSENVQVGDIVVVVRNGSKALIGKHAKIKKNMPFTVIGAFMTGIRSKHSTFINALLNTQLFDSEIEKNMGATINQITGRMFKSMEFFFPQDDEQELIGKYFDALDNLITLHQHEFEKLKNIKKAMLKKMFI